jgi:hypothetical protein
MIATTAAATMIRASSISEPSGRGSLAKADIEHPANCAPMVGRFKPNRLHPALRAIQASALRRSSSSADEDERARADIWRVDQFRSREFLGLALVRKCFGRACVCSLSRSQVKRNVPRAFGLISHHEALSRQLIKGERDSFPAIQSCHLPALWIRFPWRPVFSDSLPSQNAPAALLESAVGHHLLLRLR